MAVGDGGFSIKPMGFDKNEVNEYIGNLRKRMQEIEANKKLNDEKTEEAVKAAAEAQAKIDEAQKKTAEVAEEYEVRLKTEKRNNEMLTNQIDELKRMLKNAGSSSKANTANAEKKSEEIINAANAQARDIVERAKKTAAQILSDAQSATSASSINTDAFISAAQRFVESVGNGFKAVAEQAAALTGAAPAAVNIPDFSAISAPQAAVPSYAAAESGSALDSFDAVTEIQPLDSNNDNTMQDMFGLGGVEEIKMDESSSKPSFDADFTAALLAQSNAKSEQNIIDSSSEDFNIQPLGGMGDSSGGIDAMNQLLEQASAAFGVTGDSVQNDEPQQNSGFDDNPWASLQAELNSFGQNAEAGFDTGAGFDSGAGFDGMDSSFLDEDPQVPDADSSAIWGFGDESGTNSSDDDDMSSDFFGGF